MKRIKTFLMLMCLALSTVSYAQVTTSSMSGRVTDGQETLIGASVIATHEPSGTTYGAITNTEGRFNLQGMRTGGPYRVEVSYVGYIDFIETGVYLQLGDNYTLHVRMSESDELQLSEVVVTATGSRFAGDRNGSMNNYNNRQITMIPTMNRSIGDITKLSPYASGTGSFGGRPAYATNITVDGANFNNNFGLQSNSMPGPSASSADPISMDAIEELQVAVAPYDVRQSNFTGAAVNVVTKSGTNDFKGSAYFLFRNQDMNGTKVKDEKLEVNNSEKQVYGITLGGPIIKNKLFFFISGEIENNLTPGNTLLAGGSGRDTNDPNVNKNVTGAQMQEFSDFLNEKFGYKTGRYENWGGDNENSKKLLAKIDWNINQDHKATLRYNYSQSGSVSRPSTSGDNSPSISGSRHSATGGMSFENSQYSTVGYLHSITGELNSRFTNDISNNFLIAYTHYNQPRESDSSMFPMVDIMDGSASGNVRMTAGYELFSYNNIVDNNTLIITDNVTYNLGAHNITGGLSYENQYVRNSYWRQGTGYYRFKSLDAFRAYANGEGNGKPYSDDYHPLAFALSYPINDNTYDDVPELTFGQFSAYVQDEWNVTDAFKLTYGLRIDVPMYLSGAIDNPLVKDYTFRDGEKMEFGSWPTTKVLWSPRVGFNYDINEDKSIKLRGGLGIFTGRIPFVWFTNQPQNSGMLQYQLTINQTANQAAKDQLARIPFEANTHNLLNNSALADIFPQANVARGNLSAIDKDFKLPQVFRASIAADFRLPLDMLLTLEAIYTKDINAICFDNINLNNPQSTVKEGDLTRPYWPNNTDNPRSINSNYSYAVMMRNTSKGYGYNLSAQLTLPNFHGLSGSLAYTYSYAEEVVGKNGSDPYSAWRYRHIVDSPNSDEMGFTMNNTPHRIIVGANYQIDYAKHFKSTFSLFYIGYTGSALSYLYSTDANGDGTVNDLMYIPKNKDDVIWTDRITDPNDPTKTIINPNLTDAERNANAEAYFAYAKDNSYLSDHAGEYAKRYAAHEPFYSRLDFRFLQDFYMNIGGRKHTLQVSLDILNIPNMLNSHWGINKNYVGSNLQVTPLRFEGRDTETGKAIVSMNKSRDNFQTTAFQLPTSVSSLWNIQLGVRYIF